MLLTKACAQQSCAGQRDFTGKFWNCRWLIFMSLLDTPMAQSCAIGRG
tara:strand:- start:340 stop:483 length:144 start_codon:yes stop_codon:yes gene_type:complete